MKNNLMKNIPKIIPTKSNPTMKWILSFCFIFLCANSLIAQTPIRFKAAIDTALKNNLLIKNEQLRTEYQKKLIETGKQIPSTEIGGEVGQINSVYADSRWGITQSFRLPKVYRSQKNLLREEWIGSLMNSEVKKFELKKQVALVYYTLLYLAEKKELLIRTDTLFTEFLRHENLRFQKGEINILEKTAAENQRGQLRLQLNQLEQDIQLVQLQFQLLLNTQTPLTPDIADFKLKPEWRADTSFVSNHPTVQFYRQQSQIAAANTVVEQSKLLPDITFGYNIMSIRGEGPNNKMYNAVPQFQSVQFGLSIPIFTSAQKARISASQINELIVKNEYDLYLKNFETDYKKALISYQKNRESVAYFETTALKNADIITTSVNKKFINGDINYLEWAMLVNQAISIRIDYTETVKSLNESAIELNSFLNQN